MNLNVRPVVRSRGLNVSAPLALVTILTGLAASGAVAQRPHQAAANSPPRCAVREVSRESLVVDGHEVYVEPVALARSGRDVLLAGTPNYVWTRRGVLSELAAADSLFGVVLSPGRPPRVVPSPIGGRPILGIRAAGRGDGSWDVVFAELAAPHRMPDWGVAIRLWYARYDGNEWQSLVELPMPTNGPLHPAAGSALLARDDTLGWAIPIGATETGSEILLLERRAGQWQQKEIRPLGAAYVELADLDSVGLVMLIVRPDREVIPERPSYDENSLFFYARQLDWKVLRRVVKGGVEPVHHPTLVQANDRSVLTWSVDIAEAGSTRREARAMIGTALAKRDGGTIILDRNVVHLAGPARVGDRFIWVVEHSLLSGASGELRILDDSGGGARVLGRQPSPFTGFFALVATGSADLLIAGPKAGHSEEEPTVATLLLQMRLDCDDRTVEPNPAPS